MTKVKTAPVSLERQKELIAINKVLASLVVILAFSCGILLTQKETPVKPEQEVGAEFKKTYPVPAFNGIMIETPSNTPLIKLLKQARYQRAIDGKTALHLDELQKLVWAAQGQITEWGELTAPSYKSKFPLELNILVRQIEGVTPGWYRMDSESQQLIPTDAVIMPPEDLEAPLVMILRQKSGVETVSEMKWWEAGEISQNILLMAQELKLTAVLSYNQQPIYWLISVGHPAVDK